MPHPVSLRLDEDVQITLEGAAKERGIGLSTYLRQLAAEEANRVRRDRIRQQSHVVGKYVECSSTAREFYADWGSIPPDSANK